MKSRIADNIFFGTENDIWIAESYNHFLKENEGKYFFDVNLFKVRMMTKSKSIVIKSNLEVVELTSLIYSEHQSVRIDDKSNIEDLT